MFRYPGHGYSPDATEHASQDERDVLQAAVTNLRDAAFEVQHVSAGSSPTMPFASAGLATEYRPGTYVVGDRQQVAPRATNFRAVALTVTAPVLETVGRRVVVDAGAKAIGRDQPSWLAGHGTVREVDGPVISRLYDHHAVVDELGRSAPRTR
jgi:D-serine deaminase-like pyridoxal phosphate-dependent protein